MNMHIKADKIKVNPVIGIQLIERSDSVISLKGTGTQTHYHRDGADRRVFAWRESCPYTLKETIVSREYTFNGRDDWEITREDRL